MPKVWSGAAVSGVRARGCEGQVRSGAGVHEGVRSVAGMHAPQAQGTETLICAVQKLHVCVGGV